MARPRLYVLLFVIFCGLICFWHLRLPIVQWMFNQIVFAIEDVGSIRAYIDKNRSFYLTEAEARIDVAEKVRARSRKELAVYRDRAAKFIWKGSMPLERKPDDIEILQISGKLKEIDSLRRARHLTIKMKYAAIVRPLFLETSVKSKSCLILYHQDHNAIYLGERGWYADFLAAGCDVIAVPLPLTLGQKSILAQVKGRNLVVTSHDELAELESAKFSPLTYFLEPSLVSLNLALSEKNYRKIVAVGLSGGGWVAVIAGALDPRFTHIYPVAGTLPLYLRHPGGRNQGDWEAHGSGIYKIVNYFEFYLLGVLEQKRRAIHIYNRFDNCCYNGVLTAAFAPQIEGIARRWKLGTLKFRIDETANVHTISKESISFILKDIFEH
ncbi:MAG: hypothetical protein VX693_07235 [Pseudomonadota bacterium]|nr:hypothetical protein [Pseudomonadota bacterium]